MAAVDNGTGTSVTFQTDTEWDSGSDADQNNLLSVSWSGIERAAIDSVHMGIGASGATFGNRTFIAGEIGDGGELTLEYHFDPDDTPPIESASQTVTITWPDSGTWAAAMICTGFELNVNMEEAMTCTLTMKVIGPVTIA